MATLTLTVAAGDDDWVTNDAANDTDYGGAATFNMGGVGSTPPAGYGFGFRFTGAGAIDGATINSAYGYFMKSSTQWSTQTDRWAFEDADSPAQFDGANNQPGDRTLVLTNVADESHNINHTDGAQYQLPTTSGLRSTLGANLQAVVNRTGFAGTLALINNGDGDPSAYNNFSRKTWHCYESATSGSEPQLVVDYTVTATIEQEGFRWRNDDGNETTATWAAAQDTDITAPVDSTRRIRLVINTTNDADPAQFRLEYKKDTDGAWEVMQNG